MTFIDPMVSKYSELQESPHRQEISALGHGYLPATTEFTQELADWFYALPEDEKGELLPAKTFLPAERIQTRRIRVLVAQEGVKVVDEFGVVVVYALDITIEGRVTVSAPSVHGSQFRTFMKFPDGGEVDNERARLATINETGQLTAGETLKIDVMGHAEDDEFREVEQIVTYRGFPVDFSGALGEPDRVRLVRRVRRNYPLSAMPDWMKAAVLGALQEQDELKPVRPMPQAGESLLDLLVKVFGRSADALPPCDNPYCEIHGTDGKRLGVVAFDEGVPTGFADVFGVGNDEGSISGAFGAIEEQDRGPMPDDNSAFGRKAKQDIDLKRAAINLLDGTDTEKTD